MFSGRLKKPWRAKKCPRALGWAALLEPKAVFVNLFKAATPFNLDFLVATLQFKKKSIHRKYVVFSQLELVFWLIWGRLITLRYFQ
jgi:hypothetical protein